MSTFTKFLSVAQQNMSAGGLCNTEKWGKLRLNVTSDSNCVDISWCCTNQHKCIVVYLFTDVFVVGTQRGIHTECCLSQFIANSYVILNTIHQTGIRGLMRGMATLPRGNQELLVIRDKVGRPPGEHGVSKSIECDIFSHSVLWHCWLGDRKGIRPVKKGVELDVGLLVVMIWPELCMTYSSSSPVVTTTSISLCFNKHWLFQVHLELGIKTEREKHETWNQMSHEFMNICKAYKVLTTNFSSTTLHHRSIKTGANCIFAILWQMHANFNNFLLMNLGMNCGGSGSKLTTSPQIWCCITMQKFQCSSIQLYRKSINIKVV